jgi:signal transduction histidine kinase
VSGSGLGLAIVKRAVERANGTISLDTSPSGSRFIVHLPSR